jgi:GT2 family glycosyltransferase
MTPADRAAANRNTDARRGRVGIVVIGRNEGPCLPRCLRSVIHSSCRVVYIDSGSTDGSVALARELGVEAVELDASQPYTAARGRNTGFQWLECHAPDVRYVQFVDADTELAPGWLEAAAAELDARPRLGVVCGRLRELEPGRSIYTRLCDLEWDGPVGDLSHCGGICMMRAEALRAVGGYNAGMIAGEDPEICLRLRRAGWGVARIDAAMGVHDSRMMRFGQWWKRSRRAGHAFADMAAIHASGAWGSECRQVIRSLAWGLGGPSAALVCIALGFRTPWAWLGLPLIAALYAISIARTWSGRVRRGNSRRDAAVYAGFCALGKIPEALGVMRCWWGRVAGRRAALIEYKSPAESARRADDPRPPRPVDGVEARAP